MLVETKKRKKKKKEEKNPTTTGIERQKRVWCEWRKRRFSNCCRTTRKGDLRTAIIMGMDPEPVANGERERIMMNDDERGKCETAVANNSQDAYFLLLSSIRGAAFCVCFSSHN